ncbi:MAG TPA: TolC family protein [Thermoanaerobaculia bacterium]|jgi:outer membrane protein TolC|nr:TolC family protein [Thermoanaerobaculia bacterium]
MRFRTLAVLAMLATMALAVAGGAGAARGEQAPAAGPAPEQAPPVIRLSVAEAIRRALDEGTAAQLATERVGDAEARAQEARSALQPQLSAGGQLSNQTLNLATFGLTLPGVPLVTPPFNVVDVHITAAMNIIDLAAKRRYQAAQAGVRVSEEDRRRTENDVASAVASLYVSMGRSTARIDVIKSNVDLFGRLRQIALDQKNAGVGTRLDTTRADVQLARQQQALLVATNQRNLARLALLRAIGADLGADVVLTDDGYSAAPAPALQEALAAARQGRPELALLEQRLRTAELTIEAARAEKYPTVAAQAQGIESGNRVRDLDWSRSVGAVVNVPLFTGHRIEARVSAARSQQQQLLIQKKDTERQIEQEVRQALLNWESARSRVELADQSVKLAEDELEQAGDRFKAGVAPSIEVDNAQTSLATARDTRIDALADVSQARFDLSRATGQIRALIPNPSESNAMQNTRPDGGK